MNSPLPAQRLYRSRNNSVFAGICGGIGEYFNIDPVWIRLLFIVLLITGPGLIIYLILWVIVPLAPSNEYQQSPVPVKHLYRSRQNRMIAGVCGGLGEYFEIDPTWIRILFAVILLVFGTGLLLYLILWLIVPSRPLE